MKLECWSIGKPHESFIKEGVEDFTSRIAHYYPVSWKIFPPLKNAGSLSEPLLKQKESEMLLKSLSTTDYLILLDERGKLLASEKFAVLLQDKANASVKNVIFLIGGAFGVDDSIYKRANFVWSLSPLVFPHQLVRLILSEQIYRACTIIRNEKYHHS